MRGLELVKTALEILWARSFDRGSVGKTETREVVSFHGFVLTNTSVGVQYTHT
jgi:hypothetical protein